MPSVKEIDHIKFMVTALASDTNDSSKAEQEQQSGEAASASTGADIEAKCVSTNHTGEASGMQLGHTIDVGRRREILHKIMPFFPAIEKEDLKKIIDFHFSSAPAGQSNGCDGDGNKSKNIDGDGANNKTENNECNSNVDVDVDVDRERNTFVSPKGEMIGSNLAHHSSSNSTSNAAISHPCDADVLLGSKGTKTKKRNRHHPGNKYYEDLVSRAQTLSADHNDQTDPSNLRLTCNHVVANIRKVGGRFLKPYHKHNGDDGNFLWIEIGDEQAVETTARAIHRDKHRCLRREEKKRKKKRHNKKPSPSPPPPPSSSPLPPPPPSRACLFPEFEHQGRATEAAKSVPKEHHAREQQRHIEQEQQSKPETVAPPPGTSIAVVSPKTTKTETQQKHHAGGQENEQMLQSKPGKVPPKSVATMLSEAVGGLKNPVHVSTTISTDKPADRIASMNDQANSKTASTVRLKIVAKDPTLNGFDPVVLADDMNFFGASMLSLNKDKVGNEDDNIPNLQSYGGHDSEPRLTQKQLLCDKQKFVDSNKGCSPPPAAKILKSRNSKLATAINTDGDDSQESQSPSSPSSTVRLKIVARDPTSNHFDPIVLADDLQFFSANNLSLNKDNVSNEGENTSKPQSCGGHHSESLLTQEQLTCGKREYVDSNEGCHPPPAKILKSRNSTLATVINTNGDDRQESPSPPSPSPSQPTVSTEESNPLFQKLPAELKALRPYNKLGATEVCNYRSGRPEVRQKRPPLRYGKEYLWLNVSTGWNEAKKPLTQSNTRKETRGKDKDPSSWEMKKDTTRVSTIPKNTPKTAFTIGSAKKGKNSSSSASRECVLFVLNGMKSPMKQTRQDNLKELCWWCNVYIDNIERADGDNADSAPAAMNAHAVANRALELLREFVKLSGLQLVLAQLKDSRSDWHSVVCWCSVLSCCCTTFSKAASREILEHDGVDVLLNANKSYQTQIDLSMSIDNDEWNTLHGGTSKNQFKRIIAVWAALRDVTKEQSLLLIQSHKHGSKTKDLTKKLIVGCFETLVFLKKVGDRISTLCGSFILRHVLETLENVQLLLLQQRQLPVLELRKWFERAAIWHCLVALKNPESEWKTECMGEGSFCKAALAFFLKVYRTDLGAVDRKDNEQVVSFCVDRLSRYPRQIPMIDLYNLLLLCQRRDREFIRKQSGLRNVLTSIAGSMDNGIEEVKVFATSFLQELTNQESSIAVV